MKKLMCAIMMAAAATTALATGVSISYQGQLKDGQGHSLPLEENDTATVDFRIYTTQTGGDALWGRCCTIALDTNGYFNVELSDNSGSSLPENPTNRLADVLAKHTRADTLFLGLTVKGSSGEIAPRQKLLSVPVAAFALDANQANGDFTVSGIATVNGPLVAKSTLQVSGKTEIRDMDVSGTLRLSGKAARLQTAFGEDVVPVGVIVMWSGSVDKIPKGWALCDGQKNNTPDLRGRFIVGVNPNNNKNDKRDVYEPGSYGGNERISLSVAEMPSHSHTVPLNWGWSYDNVGGARYWRNTGSGGGSDSRTTERTGGDQPHENRPPYYALCFIMKVSEASEKAQ